VCVCVCVRACACAEIRVSLRPRRALSLDRPISMPPFLRPIEEEESTAMCSDRTPTETMFVGAMTSPPSSPGSSLSSSTSDDDDDDDDLPTDNGNGSHRGKHHRRRHYHVDANKLYGQNRWMNLGSKSGATTTDNKLTMRPTTICCEPDFGATCFDSDEECLCTSTGAVHCGNTLFSHFVVVFCSLRLILTPCT